MLQSRIDPYRRLVVLTGIGEVMPVEILAAQERLPADPVFRPGFSLLLDMRDALLVDFAPDQLRRLAVESPFGTAARRAYVVRHAALELLRQCQTYSDLMARGGALRLFRDLDAATAWLEGRRA